MASDRALFERFPSLRAAFPIVELGDFPTPISQIQGLKNQLNIDHLWIKHDENCAPTYGGNKIRKLEFLLGDIQARGFNSVLTYGGVGSNHALATAINCKQLGLRCIVILTPEPATEAVRNTLQYHLALGTDIRVASTYGEVQNATQSVLKEQGEQCYEIPFGGSSWLGACGFVNAGLELATQVAAGQMPEPDVIFMAMGTTGSAAGLALGLELAGLKSKIEAVQVTPASMRQDTQFARLFAEANKFLNQHDVNVPLYVEPFRLAHLRNDQLGEGYAIPTPAAQNAAEFANVHLKFPTSLTYTAKALAGLISDAARGELADKEVLFWNTYNARPYPSFKADDAWKKLPGPLHQYFTSEKEI